MEIFSLQTFFLRLCSSFFLIYKINTQQALELASVVMDGLSPRPLPLYLWPEERVVDLSPRRDDDSGDGNDDGIGAGPAKASTTDKGNFSEAISGGASPVSSLGPEYRRLLTCPNPEETNSAVEVSFQVRFRWGKGRGREEGACCFFLCVCLTGQEAAAI